MTTIPLNSQIRLQFDSNDGITRYLANIAPDGDTPVLGYVEPNSPARNTIFVFDKFCYTEPNNNLRYSNLITISSPIKIRLSNTVNAEGSSYYIGFNNNTQLFEFMLGQGDCTVNNPTTLQILPAYCENNNCPFPNSDQLVRSGDKIEIEETANGNIMAAAPPDSSHIPSCAGATIPVCITAGGLPILTITYVPSTEELLPMVPTAGPVIVVYHDTCKCRKKKHRKY